MVERKNSFYLNKKFLLIVAISLFFIIGLLFFNGRKNSNEYTLKDFNQCLADNGIVIYGSEWCPACNLLVETLGGYEKVGAVYVECIKEQERCQRETKTDYIPEIQINGEVYEGLKSLNSLAEMTGCKIPD